MAILSAAFCAFLVPCIAAQAPSAQGRNASAGPALQVSPGEKILLQLQTPLHTRTARAGDRVRFLTTGDLRLGDRIALPRGTEVRASVSKSRRAGRIAGRAELQLQFKEILLPDGTKLPFDAKVLRAGFKDAQGGGSGDPKLKGEAGSGGDIQIVSSGAIQGALIGLSAGAKGAGYGAAIGAAIGLASIILQRGPDLDIAEFTMFEVRLDKPLAVPESAVQAAVPAADAAPAYQDASPRRADANLPAQPVPPDPASIPAPVAPSPASPAGAETAGLPPAPPAVPGTSAGRDPGLVRPPVRRIPEVPVPDTGADFTLKVNVPHVLVETVVKDRSGKYLESLQKADFRLFENGLEQELASLSRDELPLAIALVIDRSGSVAPFMDELRLAANSALAKLKPGDQAALFSFSRSVERLEDLTTDRSRVAERIATIQGGGGTNIGDALHEAVSYLGRAAAERRHAVILISDNQSTVRPRAGHEQIVRLALETETVIYSIKAAGVSSSVTMMLPDLLFNSFSVGKIAEETGGEMIKAGGSGSFDAALGEVVTRLRLRYTLGYAPGDTQGGGFRTIDVRLADRFGRPGGDYQVFARRGYYPRSERRP